jgi:UDP-glucose 4-epimerase
VSELWAITGASGFIGRHLVDVLAKRGARVRKLEGRITDREALAALVRGAGVVVHLAAYVHERADTAEERRECWSTNVEGTRLLLDAITAEAPSAFLIFVSTANVYPASDKALDETAAVDPKTYYGQTKLAAESLVLASGRQAAILRPAMVFGPGEPGNLGKFISMIRSRVVLLPRGGRNQKSLVPVEMLCAAIAGVAEHRRIFNREVLDVAGAAMPMRRIVEILTGALGIRAIRVAIPLRPLKAMARAVDAVTVALRIPSPNFHQMVETYGSSAVIRDDKLRRVVSLGGVAEVETALRETAISPAWRSTLCVPRSCARR